MDSELDLRLEKIEARLAALEASVPSRQRDQPERPNSVSELLAGSSARSGLDVAIVIAWYLEEIERTTPFTLTDLRVGHGKAKHPLPANSRDLVHRAIQKGLMMETGGERDGFRTLTLTNSGLSRARRLVGTSVGSANGATTAP